MISWPTAHPPSELPVVPSLHVLVDARERYPYRVAGQQVQTERRALLDAWHRRH